MILVPANDDRYRTDAKFLKGRHPCPWQGFNRVDWEEEEVQDPKMVELYVEDGHCLEVNFLHHEFFDLPLLNGWEDALGLRVRPVPIFYLTHTILSSTTLFLRNALSLEGKSSS